MSILQQRIAALRVSGLRGDFIPQGDLHALVSQPVIIGELRHNNHPPEDLSEAVDLLVTGGRKVFAILVELGAVDRIADFLSADLLDGKLPLRNEDLEHFNNPGLTVKFLKFQWDYIAPLWGDGSSSHKVLSTRSILPFTEEKPVSDGSFGRTFIVTLKSTHQRFFECSNTDVGLTDPVFLLAAISSCSALVDLCNTGGADVLRSMQRMCELYGKSSSTTGLIL